MNFRLTIPILLFACALFGQSAAPPIGPAKVRQLVMVDKLPAGAEVIAAPVSVSMLASLPMKNRSHFGKVKELSFSPCDPAVEDCSTPEPPPEPGHGLSPPPDQTDCTSLPPGPCWYIGWGWYICYVGC